MLMRVVCFWKFEGFSANTDDSGRMTLVLYRRRAHEKVEVSAASRRAFDKAVRRKPLADAADAGLWKLNGAEERYRGMPVRWAGATRRVAGS